MYNITNIPRKLEIPVIVYKHRQRKIFSGYYKCCDCSQGHQKESILFCEIKLKINVKKIYPTF